MQACWSNESIRHRASPRHPALPAQPTDTTADLSSPAAIDAAALQALRLLPDEPQRAMRLHARAHEQALALGHERGLLRLRIVALNEQARFGQREDLAAGIAEAQRQADSRQWMGAP